MMLSEISETADRYVWQIVIGLVLMLLGLAKFIGRRYMKKVDALHAIHPEMASLDNLRECQIKVEKQIRQGFEQIREDYKRVEEKFDTGLTGVHTRLDNHINGVNRKN